MAFLSPSSLLPLGSFRAQTNWVEVTDKEDIIDVDWQMSYIEMGTDPVSGRRVMRPVEWKAVDKDMVGDERKWYDMLLFRKPAPSALAEGMDSQTLAVVKNRDGLTVGSWSKGLPFAKGGKPPEPPTPPETVAKKRKRNIEL